MGRWRAPAARALPYITVAGYAALEAEVKGLHARRREVVTHLAAAAAEGDRSENAEYLYRKKELRELDRRIGYLERRMPTLTIVRAAPPSRERVYFGAAVELEDAVGALLRYRIVGSDEAAPATGAISVDSPVARALLGRRLGDEIGLEQVAAGTRYTIVAIDYPCVAA
jgi:transcription elongation factor GreB